MYFFRYAVMRNKIISGKKQFLLQVRRKDM